MYRKPHQTLAKDSATGKLTKQWRIVGSARKRTLCKRLAKGKKLQPWAYKYLPFDVRVRAGH